MVLRGWTISSTVVHETTASKAQAVTEVERGAGVDQGLWLFLCARAAQDFPKSSQNQVEISLNKAVPEQGFSKCPGTTDKRWFNRSRMKVLFC